MADPLLHEVWSRRTSLVWRKVGDEAVVLDPEGAMLRGLNDTGWRVWEALDGSRALSEISEEIQRLYGLTLERAQQDVLAFLSALDKAGLVGKVR